MKTKFLHCGLVVLGCLVLAGSALANTITVTTLADSGPGSLRAAIPATSTGGTIVYQAGLAGTITLTSGELQIGRSMNIVGPGAAILTISGNNSSRVFNISSSAATVTLSGLTISGGKTVGADGTADTGGAEGEGGGILNSGTLTLMNCTISDNTVSGGYGPISSDQGGYGGDGLGGGICNFDGTLTLSACLLKNNTASGGASAFLGGYGQGGAIYSFGTFALTNCTVSANSAQGAQGGTAANGGEAGAGEGGGVFLFSAGGSLVNCTIAGNLATGWPSNISYSRFGGSGSGGGIYVQEFGSLLLSCTISGNTSVGYPGTEGDGAARGGGIYIPNHGTVKNTIISGNSVIGAGGPSDYVVGPDVNGTVTDGGFNLIGRTDGSSGWSSSVQLGGTTDATRLDPQLGPLQNNGGPTPTMSLSPDSAAIDAGTNFGIATDQLGQPRPLDWPNVDNAPGGDGSDIGAVEFCPPLTTLVSIVGGGQGMGFSWPNNTPQRGGPQNVRSFFGLETLKGNFVPYSGAWAALQQSVKVINNTFVAHDQIVPGNGAAFYRLNSSVTNRLILPQTLPATQVTNYYATLNGNYTPDWDKTKYWYEYGTDTNYSLSTLTNNLATSSNQLSLPFPISGLNQMTTYHFQLVITDDDGTQYGGDQTFTTPGLLPVVMTYEVDGDNGPDWQGLTGTINGEGTPALAYFEYGTSTNYGAQTPNFYTRNPYDTEIFTNRLYFEGLVANTTYHFRAVGFNGAGKGVGADMFFITPP